MVELWRDGQEPGPGQVVGYPTDIWVHPARRGPRHGRRSGRRAGLDAQQLVRHVGGIPLTDVLALLIGLPLVAAAGGWLLAGREPEVIARQPLD